MGARGRDVTLLSSDLQTGDTRVAIQRAKVCMELASKGCDLATREGYIACQRAAKTNADFDKCDDNLSCGAPATSPSVAAGAGHAPTAHPTPAPSHAPSGKPAASGSAGPPKKKK